MKLLLFLTNLLVLSILPSTCNNAKDHTAEESMQKDTIGLDSNLATIDTLHALGDTPSATSADTTKTGMSKDDKYNSGSQEKHEAPKHNSPNQEKVDSIKASKKKTKSEKD